MPFCCIKQSLLSSGALDKETEIGLFFILSLVEIRARPKSISQITHLCKLLLVLSPIYCKKT